MKTNASLFLAAFGLLLATGASATPNRFENEMIALPTYIVSAPRYLPFEKQMNANLREVCKQARTPMAVSLELPLSKTQAPAPKLALNVTAAKAARSTKS